MPIDARPQPYQKPQPVTEDGWTAEERRVFKAAVKRLAKAGE